MTRIIVTGVDSSRTAFDAAEKAAELAGSLGGVLHICTAYSPSSADTLDAMRTRNTGKPDPVAYKKLKKGVADAAEQVAESVAAILRESHPDLTIEAPSVAGYSAEALLKQAEKLQADVIVVGNKNVQGVSRVLGSVARKVASEAKCDLYIVNTVHR